MSGNRTSPWSAGFPRGPPENQARASAESEPRAGSPGRTSPLRSSCPRIRPRRGSRDAPEARRRRGGWRWARARCRTSGSRGRSVPARAARAAPRPNPRRGSPSAGDGPSAHVAGAGNDRVGHLGAEPDLEPGAPSERTTARQLRLSSPRTRTRPLTGAGPASRARRSRAAFTVFASSMATVSGPRRRGRE